MTATLAFVAAGGEMYLDSDRALSYVQPTLREVYRAPSRERRRPSPQLSPARGGGSGGRRGPSASASRPSTAPASGRRTGGGLRSNHGQIMYDGSVRPKPKFRRSARPVDTENRPSWDTDTHSPSRPTNECSGSRGRSREDLSHLRPNQAERFFDRDNHMPRKGWDDCVRDIRVPPDKGSPLKKPFRARAAPQPKLRFKGSPPKRKPQPGFAKAPAARKASGPAGPGRRPKAEFMGVSSYKIQHPTQMENDGVGGGTVLRVPPASAAIYAARDESDGGSVSRSPTAPLDNVVARALSSAHDYDVEGNATARATTLGYTETSHYSSASSEPTPPLTSPRSESSPWGTLELRVPQQTTDHSAVSIVTAVDVDSDDETVSVEDAIWAAAAAPRHRESPFSPPVAQTPPELVQQSIEPEPEPEPEPQRQSLPMQQGAVPRGGLFSQPLQRAIPTFTDTDTTTAWGAAMAQGQAEWSQGGALTDEEEAARKAALAREEAAERAMRQRALEEEKEARRKADEYAALVMPARARYEAALQQLKASEAATQERWATRRRQDNERLAAARHATVVARESKEAAAQENEWAVLEKVDKMRPKVVAYKEQYAAWYKRAYGASAARQPSRTRRMVAGQAAALRLPSSDVTELLSNHLLDIVLADIAEEVNGIVGGTVDRVVAGELVPRS